MSEREAIANSNMSEAQRVEYWASVFAEAHASTVEGVLSLANRFWDCEETDGAGIQKQAAGRAGYAASTLRQWRQLKLKGESRFVTISNTLPSSWRTLYELTLLDDDEWQAALDAGAITPSLKQSDAKALRKKPDPPPPDLPDNIADLLSIYQADVRDVASAELEAFDAIITDPPYPKEFLPLFSSLAENAAKWLKPDGVCVVMSGQLYLPDVYARMSEHLRYIWTCAYMIPGGGTQVFPCKVNNFWKPLLVYGRANTLRNWIGDVAVSDERDKAHHHWGQSESGMSDVIERFTKPGDRILEPFLGGGTTALVAAQLGRFCTGFDLDPEHVATARRRLFNDG